MTRARVGYMMYGCNGGKSSSVAVCKTTDLMCNHHAQEGKKKRKDEAAVSTDFPLE